MVRRTGKYNSRSPPITVNYSSAEPVARMERSAMRENSPGEGPDFAELHPGYELSSLRTQGPIATGLGC